MNAEHVFFRDQFVSPQAYLDREKESIPIWLVLIYSNNWKTKEILTPNSVFSLPVIITFEETWSA